MGAQLNLFIHGNPSGLDCWYNRKELGELSPEEASYIRSFYTSNRGDSAPRFVVETKTEGSGGIISYYHYLVLGGIYEESGRPSGYIGLTLRIGKAFAPDLLQIYLLLQRLFEEKTVGRLVERKGDQGYQFCVGKLTDLEDVFLQWETDLAKKCQCVLRTIQLPRVASTKTSVEASFALADLLEGALQVIYREQLAQGCRLIFSNQTSSQRELAACEKLKEENEKLQERMRGMTSEKTSLSGEIEKLKDEKDKLNISLKEKTEKLEDHRRVLGGILEGISHLLGKQGAQSSQAFNSGKDHQVRTTSDDSMSPLGHTHEGAGRESTFPRFTVAILLGLLALLFVSQIYMVFQVRSLSATDDSKSMQYNVQVDSIQVCDSAREVPNDMKGSEKLTSEGASEQEPEGDTKYNKESEKKQ